MFCRLSTPNNQKGDNSLCTGAWTSLYRVNYMFVFLHFIVLGSSEQRTPRGEMFFSKVIINTSEHKPKSDSVVGILLPLLSSSNSSGVTITKHTQNVDTCIPHGQTTCIQLLIAGHYSQQELTAVCAISRTAGVLTFRHYASDRICGLVVRVSGYRYRGLGFYSRRYQIF